MATKPTDIPAVKSSTPDEGPHETAPIKTPGEIAIEAAENEAKARAADQAKSKEQIPKELMTKVYRVLNDGIVAGDEKQALGINVLTGIVTREDIENSGSDFAWLLRTGIIEEAGYR